jgi:hypothetical protein
MSGQPVFSSCDDFEASLERAVTNKERVRFMRHCREVAAIVPIEDLDLLEELGAIDWTCSKLWRPLRKPRLMEE